MHHALQRRTLAAAVVAAAAVAACSSGGSGKGLTVSATAAPRASGSSRAALEAGNGIVIDRIRVVVADFEVEGSAACAAPTGPTGPTGVTGPTGPTGAAGPMMDGREDGSGDDGGECEVEGGPFLVDLSGADLSGGVHAVAGIAVPAGTYDEIRFRIRTITPAQAGTDAGLAAMAQAGASILVDGTDGGVPFQFSSAIRVSQKREGSIVVDPATGANVTLDFDPSGWFQGPAGTKLAPADPAMRSAIESSIRASIRVKHDDDHDGHDDEGHDGGDDGTGGGGPGDD